eukprot:gb/GECG01011251.1/.p1 GENE.gb/GECG01011251.1/~~gb/GECG01011251.1/.p1  ORF type:complete len:117 (+),score=18.37 gb/GECG01011251.1/:1-351(+)
MGTASSTNNSRRNREEGRKVQKSVQRTRRNDPEYRMTGFDLRGATLDDRNAKDIADALREGKNTTLTKINLANNQIGGTGAQHLADALRVNTALTVVHIWKNQIGAIGVQNLAEAL